MKTNKTIQELKRIARENDGLLQPEVVVEEARPLKSPLHKKFQWDDTIAGQQYRIWQARQLIRISVEVLTGMKERMDVFVSLSPDRDRESGGYRVMLDVLSDVQMRKQMLKDALEELENFSDKYHKLEELAEIFSAIKKVRRKK
jgi:hypothetical protein